MGKLNEVLSLLKWMGWQIIAVIVVLSFLIGVSVARADGTIDRTTNYEGKIVKVEERELDGGCTLVEVTLESKHGDNTQGTLDTRVFIACPQAVVELENNE